MAGTEVAIRGNDGNNVLMEGVRLIFKNFAGKEGQYNRAGDRNFAVVLEPEVAQAMTQDGWNVKQLRQREEDDAPTFYLPVAVGYRDKSGNPTRPPTVVLITSRGRTNIGEDMIEMVDWADIKTVDLIVRPYDWAVSGKTGRKAYLKSLYVVIDEDPLALKYADVPQIGSGGALELEAFDENVIDGEVVSDEFAD